MKQNYSNHRKYYIPHHFIFLPLVTGLLMFGVFKALHDEARNTEWWMFSVVCFCILYLSVMLRQRYALGNQNRIVRLEFRLRYFELFGESSKAVEENISFQQIAALRFADDKQFTALLRDPLLPGIGADDIKRSITNWQADDMRV